MVSILRVFMMACMVGVVACKVEVTEEGESNGSQQYGESYEFKNRSCSTGKHKFEADTQTELDRKVCDTLLEEEKNNYCSQISRQRHFENRCHGRLWIPRYPNPSNSNKNVNVSDLRWGQQKYHEKYVTYVLPYISSKTMGIGYIVADSGSLKRFCALLGYWHASESVRRIQAGDNASSYFHITSHFALRSKHNYTGLLIATEIVCNR